MFSRPNIKHVEAAVPAAMRPASPATRLPPQRYRVGGFTLAELVVSVGVLVLLVVLATQLFNSAATITTLGHKQMDADSQAREVLDRMAIDFAQMVKRSDVDYYLKSPGNSQTGNDQMAFYTASPGYFGTSPQPTPTYTNRGRSPISLVSYRINPNNTWSSYNRMERLGKGLVWNWFPSGWNPIMFLPQTIRPSWDFALFPSTAVNSEYEVIGPQIFRFEYYYLLKGQNDQYSNVTYASALSATPWDTRINSCCSVSTPTPSPAPTPTATPIPTPAPSLCCHTSPNGMQDVAAVIVDIAVIDVKSRILIADCQLAKLNGAPPPPSCGQPQQQILVDYSADMVPGQLLTQWRAAIDSNSIGLPQPVLSGIRLYERYFYLSPPTLLTP